MAAKKRRKARMAAKARMESEVRLRLSDADKARLLAAAERERLDFSPWARRVLLREADTVLGTTT
jgi:hypothetical protein